MKKYILFQSYGFRLNLHPYIAGAPPHHHLPAPAPAWAYTEGVAVARAEADRLVREAEHRGRQAAKLLKRASATYNGTVSPPRHHHTYAARGKAVQVEHIRLTLG